MHNNPFGWSYPAGAENDPRAPWNQEDMPETWCERCDADVGEQCTVVDDVQICLACLDEEADD